MKSKNQKCLICKKGLGNSNSKLIVTDNYGDFVCEIYVHSKCKKDKTFFVI